MATAEIKSELKLSINITLTLTLEEAKALNEITGYGVDAFLEGYYKQLGKSYMQPHERGCRSLFETINKNLPPKLYNAGKIIDAVNEVKELNK